MKRDNGKKFPGLGLIPGLCDQGQISQFNWWETQTKHLRRHWPRPVSLSCWHARKCRRPSSCDFCPSCGAAVVTEWMVAIRVIMMVNRTVCPACNGISFNTQDFPLNGPDLEQKQMIVFIWRAGGGWRWWSLLMVWTTLVLRCEMWDVRYA